MSEEQIGVNIEPKIKMVSVSYERKFNLGEYESLGIEVQLWADLDPEASVADETIRRMIEKARQHVKEQAMPAILKSTRYNLQKQRAVAGVTVDEAN